ncbi:hypothetical protein HanRHA438_Chr00c76g0862751 [Helianthus annuus]|nr:hypothetical protein HanRHA438_Chr00c76g0862751 [Helianthus annuus]
MSLCLLSLSLLKSYSRLFHQINPPKIESIISPLSLIKSIPPKLNPSSLHSLSSNQSPPKLNPSSLHSLKSFTDELAVDMPICRPHTWS